MASRVDLSAKLPEIAAICRRFDVRELSLFGPAFRTDSDLDFLIEFNPAARIGLIQLGLLQQELETLLGRKVDLVPKSGLKPLIRDSVLHSSEPVYADYGNHQKRISNLA
ncbi:MAG: nucleotidyltransferase domain-containing protein [Acidobacteriia bacterium]|nr:nucleotidyltransferase domain-containing protein [Terriglobia bacterium]